MKAFARIRRVMILPALILTLMGCAQSGGLKKEASPTLHDERFAVARDLEEKGHWEAAEKSYRELRDLTLERNPPLAALCEWRLSFVLEAQGDDLKALAHLMGAEKHLALLPEQVGRAELPARKALFLHRVGRGEEAEKELLRAERGLRVLLSGARPKPDPAWLARLYYEMGRSLTPVVSEESFYRDLRALAVSQGFLFKAVDLGQEEWSRAALENLRGKYSLFWTGVMTLPVEPGMESLARSRQLRGRQVPLLTAFMSVLEEADALTPVNAARANPWQKDLIALIAELRDRIQGVLYENAETTILTEESRRLNGLRREGRIRERNGRAPERTDESGPPSSGRDPNL